MNVCRAELSLAGGTRGTFCQVSRLLASETCPVASLHPPLAKWGSGVRQSHSLLERSGGRISGALSPEAFWVLFMGPGRAVAPRTSPPITDHRGAPETRGGPGAQDKPKGPSPKN